MFIDSTFGPHIAPVGWLLNNGSCTLGGGLRFWECGSTGPTGAPIATGARLPCSRQMTSAEPAQWSDPATVLSGWDPRRDR